MVFLIDHTYQIYKLRGRRALTLAQKVQKALYPRLSPEDLEMDQNLDSILDLIWVFLPKTQPSKGPPLREKVRGVTSRNSFRMAIIISPDVGGWNLLHRD